MLMTDVVTFLRARIDEDEAVAREVADARRLSDVGGGESASPRVLREVEADRKLLAAWRKAEAERDGLADGLRAAVQIRAAIWRHHPDYDPAWGVTG
jgi:hypothetical protein